MKTLNKELQAQWAVGAIGTLKEKYTRKQLWSKFSEQIYADSAKALGVELFPRQHNIIHAKQKTKIVRAARRTAKSFNIAFITYSLLRFSSLFSFPLHIKFAGPRAEDCRHVWDHLSTFILTAQVPDMPMVYDNLNNTSTHKKEMRFANGTWVKSASCDSPEMNDIRGDAHDFLVVDEFGQIKYKNAFLEAALYSLKDADPLNMLMIVGTFDVVGVGEEFDRLYKLGQEERPDIKSWTLKGSDNPYSDPTSALTAKDIVTEEGYQREELGEGVPSLGRMFPDMNLRSQVAAQKYDSTQPLLIGLDFGYRKPIVEFIQLSGDKIRVLYELSLKDIRIDPLITEIKAVLIGKFNNTTPLIIGCDPAGDKENDVVSYNSFDKLHQAFPTSQYTRHPQLVSKSNQVILLKALTIQDRIAIDPQCEKLIRAFAMATPDITRTGAVNSPGWKKEKGVDDPLDALAYCLINYGPTAALIVPEDVPHKVPSNRRVEAAMSNF